METTSRVRPPRALWIAVVAVVAVAGIAVGLLIGRGDGNQVAPADPTVQLASVQQACEQWQADRLPTQAGPDDWCSGMAGWMSDYMATNEVGPQMMWGDPDRMHATCQQWLTESPPTRSGTDVDAQQWCDAMVEWMREHMNDWSGHHEWDDWSEHGPGMMGR